jgi:molecular chaperone Hsp33
LAVACRSYGPCDQQTLRAKFVKALASLGRKEVETMIEEDGQIEIKCDLCNEPSVFTQDHVEEIFTVPAGTGFGKK